MKPPYKAIDIIFKTYEQQLVSLLRYERFMHDESPKEWQEILGPDVVSITHPKITADITQKFITYNAAHGILLTDEEQSILLTTPWIHDLGELTIEGEGVGDISYDQKNYNHEKVEHAIFYRILKHVSDPSTASFIERAYMEVAMNHETKLGKMFNAIERIGYLQTAIRAFVGVGGTRIYNWKALVGNVLSNQIDRLLIYSHEYPYMQFIVDFYKNDITQALAAINIEAAPQDGRGMPAYDTQKISQAIASWKSHREK